MRTFRQDDHLIELLKSVKKKLLFQRFFLLFGKISFFVLIFDILLLGISRVLPITYYKETALFLISFSLIGVVIYLLFKKPSYYLAAKKADRFGLEERITTAFNHRDNSSKIAKLQREDTIKVLQNRLPDILNGIRIWPFNRKHLIMYFSLFLAIGILLFTPNLMDSILAEKKVEKQKIEAAKENIEKQQEEIKNNNDLTVKKKEALVKSLDELKKDLDKANKLEDKLKEIKKVSKELLEAKNNEKKIQDSYEKMIKSLSENKLLEELSKALNQENQEELLQALNEMKDKLESLSEKDKQELAQALQNISKMWQELSKQLNNEDLAKIAQNLQKAANGFQNGESNQSLEALQNSLLNSMQQNSGAQQTMAQLSNTISSLQQTTSSSTLSNNTSSGSSGSANGNGGNNGNSSSASSGSNGGNGNNGQGNGAGLGKGSHNIGVPTNRINSEGITDTVNGPLGEGDSESRISGNTNISVGTSLPYNEVFMEYQEFARQSMENNEIPSDYQDIIKDYFSSIEP